MNFNFLKEWPFWAMVGIFLGTLILAISDPFKLDPEGINSTSAIKALYFIPAIIAWVWTFVLPTFGIRSEGGQEVAIEKVKSIVRSAIQIIGSLIAVDAAFNLDIPFLELVFTVAGYIGENIDTAANAIGVILGIGTTLYGFFKDKDRFEVRAGRRLK
jgi:hypothetical protein